MEVFQTVRTFGVVSAAAGWAAVGVATTAAVGVGATAVGLMVTVAGELVGKPATVDLVSGCGVGDGADPQDASNIAQKIAAARETIVERMRRSIRWAYLIINLETPASTFSSAAVICEASSDAKNTTALPKSSGV